jgi:hypothetical protein
MINSHNSSQPCLKDGVGPVVGAGTQLTITRSRDVGVEQNALRVRFFSVLATLCTVCLIILRAIFLYSANTGASVPILVFVVLEVFALCWLRFLPRALWLPMSP